MSRDSEDESGEITRLISEFVAGVPGAQDRLFPLIYDELHGRAARIQRERPGETLCPTELVNEAYLRLVQQRFQGWQDRRHFLVFAAQVIRRVLVDRARRRAALRHGGGRGFVQLEMDPTGARAFSPLDLVALDEALESLANLDARQARIVELRYFAGCTIAEVAATLEVSRSTIDKEERKARAFLALSLGGMAQ